MADVLWLTQDAHDMLAQELAEREGPRRKDIVIRIEAAREEGDLKENGGYHAAKDEQGKNEARVVQLKSILDGAQIGAPKSAEDEAAHGKVITVEFPSLGFEETFLLASREEASHTSMDVYSPNSPLGAAINGRRIGDTVTYELPNGNTMEAKILTVRQREG